MGYLFKTYISDEIVEKQFKTKYGDKYKLKLDIQYQFQYRSHKVDVGFTKDRKGFWLFKYKGEYYMNIIEDITFKDKYQIIDVYTTLMENAVDTYKSLTGLMKIRKNAVKKREK